MQIISQCRVDSRGNPFFMRNWIRSMQTRLDSPEVRRGGREKSWNRKRLLPVVSLQKAVADVVG